MTLLSAEHYSQSISDLPLSEHDQELLNNLMDIMYRDSQEDSKKYYAKFVSLKVLKAYIEEIAREEWISLWEKELQELVIIIARFKICGKIRNLQTIDHTDYKAIEQEVKESIKLLNISFQVWLYQELFSQVTTLTKRQHNNSTNWARQAARRHEDTTHALSQISSKTWKILAAE